VLQLTVAGSSSRASAFVSGTEGGTVPRHGVTWTHEDVRASGTIGLTFIASTSEVPAATGELWAAVTPVVCGAQDADTVPTATRARA
jgi:hypothetical protein